MIGHDDDGDDDDDDTTSSKWERGVITRSRFVQPACDDGEQNKKRVQK